MEFMGNFTWTNEQKAAIDFSAAANLLVSAAAGSGKTTVLAERIIKRAVNGDLDLSRILVMTFTDLAAKQMRNKIESRLLKARAEATGRPEQERLDFLLRVLPQAQISTIHSYCNRLLGDYLAEYKDDSGQPFLEPGYSLLDEESAASLLDQVLDQILSENYSLLSDLKQNQLKPDWLENFSNRIDILLPQADPLDYLRDFDRLTCSFSPGLSDENFRKALTGTLGKLRSLPDYRNFVQQSVKRFVCEVENFPEQELLDQFFDIYFNLFKKAKAALPRLRKYPHYDRLIDPKEKGVNIQQQFSLMSAAEELVAVLDDITEASADNFTRIAEAGQSLDGIAMPSKQSAKSEKGINNNEFVDFMSSDVMPLFYLINGNNKISDNKKKEYFPDLEPVFSNKLEDMKQDLEISVDPVVRFFELVLAVDKEFQKEKFSRNLVEFSDFEHGAFQLLQQEDIRREVQQHYDEIYIDEYQDTSSIQDKIVSCIAKDNVFMVGDVKQSIYRFRYANPRLFQKRADRAQPFSSTNTPVLKDYLLNLSTNFRSNSNIIHFVNQIFSSFLTRKAAEIEYDEGQRLYVGTSGAEAGKVSWRIITNYDTDQPEITTENNDARLDSLNLNPGNEIERLSLLAADTIYTLLDQKAELKDIALLCCTNAQCKDLRDSLEKLGIPVTGTFGGIYPENLVVRQFEALLKVLDNPRQDIPLATFLASALSGDPLRPEEFMRVRLIAEQNFLIEKKPKLRYFHERVMLAVKSPVCDLEADENIRLKLKKATDRIQRWRLLARERNMRDLLSLILQETQFEKVIEQSDSSPKSRNISRRRLTELNQFLKFVKESSFQGFDSVQKLLRRLEKLRQRDIFPDDSELQSDLDAVRVLTYHRSKGLEWPYVILLGLDNDQVKSDNDLISVDEHDGIRSYSISANGLSVANNFLNREKMRNEQERERAEAWRRLYVGMTRAKKQLYLMNEYKGLPEEDNFLQKQIVDIAEARVQKQKTGNLLLPAGLVRKCKSYSNILWSVLLLHYPEEITAVFSREKTQSQLPYINIETIPYKEILEKESLQNQETEKNEILTEDTLLLSDSAFDSDSPSSDVEKLVALLTEDLPYRTAAEAPSKLTVTELKRAGAEETTLPEGAQLTENDTALSFESWIRQKKGSTAGQPEEIALTLRKAEAETDKITPAERGTHLHSFLRFLDLATLINLPDNQREQELGRQMEQMIAKLQLSEQARSVITEKYPHILAYADSRLAQRVVAAEKEGRVYREMPFTMAVPASTIGEEYPADELTLVQGMIDLWFVEADNQAVLVDFKTDHLPLNLYQQDLLMRERYHLQINFYAQAIEHATKRKVKEKHIWLLNADRSLNF